MYCDKSSLWLTPESTFYSNSSELVSLSFNVSYTCILLELSATRVMLYILQHLQRGDTDVMLTLEVFCGLFFMFLSTEPKETKFITELYLSVFSDEKVFFIKNNILIKFFQTSHLAHKLRMVSQTFIYSYSMCSRTDRTLARTLGSPYPVLRWGGLRPFFQRSKIVK